MLTASRVVGSAALAVVLAAAVAGCSDDDEGDPKPGPADVEVPEGITLTSGGSTVNLGQPASVIYQPDDAGRTVITVRVDDITRGRPKDLAGVDGVPDGAVPFYVRASVHNAGPATLGGARPPLYAIDGAGDAIDATEMTGTHECDPLSMDELIERGATVKGCLVFALPKGSAFGGVQVRGGDSSPVTWKP